MKRESFVFAGCQLPLIAAALTISAPAVNAAEEATVFARVDDVVITREEFEREVYSAARQTYYHGRPPSGEEFIEFRKDVADRLIDRQLLLMEARRRNLEPDHQSVDAKIAGYEARYAGTERWQNEGPKMIAALQSRFEEDSLLAALEAEVRSVEEPEPSELREYYDDNADLFTEPARNRVSIILLGVPPSASAAAWGRQGKKRGEFSDAWKMELRSRNSPGCIRLTQRRVPVATWVTFTRACLARTPSRRLPRYRSEKCLSRFKYWRAWQFSS